MEWFTCRRRILRGRYSTSSHSASDAAIAFPRGATPCAKSIPTQAGQKGAPPHPPSDPAPQSEGLARLPICAAHPSRRKHGRRAQPRKESEELRKSPQVIIPHTRGRPRAGTVAEHHSAHTETREDAGTVAEHPLNAVARSPVAHRTAAGL